jgi:hypothetical protein
MSNDIEQVIAERVARREKFLSRVLKGMGPSEIFPDLPPQVGSHEEWAILSGYPALAAAHLLTYGWVGDPEVFGIALSLGVPENG